MNLNEKERKEKSSGQHTDPSHSSIFGIYTTIKIPYVEGVSDKIRKKCARFGVRTVFNKSTTLRNILTKVKPPEDKRLRTKIASTKSLVNVGKFTQVNLAAPYLFA